MDWVWREINNAKKIHAMRLGKKKSACGIDIKKHRFLIVGSVNESRKCKICKRCIREE